MHFKDHVISSLFVFLNTQTTTPCKIGNVQFGWTNCPTMVPTKDLSYLCSSPKPIRLLGQYSFQKKTHTRKPQVEQHNAIPPFQSRNRHQQTQRVPVQVPESTSAAFLCGLQIIIWMDGHFFLFLLKLA